MEELGKEEEKGRETVESKERPIKELKSQRIVDGEGEEGRRSKDAERERERKRERERERERERREREEEVEKKVKKLKDSWRKMMEKRGEKISE